MHADPLYTARKDFSAGVVWKKIRGVDTLVVNNGADGPVDIAHPVLVGRVSDDRPWLEPHGSFNPKYDPEKAIKQAKLAITVVSPIGDPDFEVDFTPSINSLINVQKAIATSNMHQHLLISIGEGTGIRLNFPIWEKKTEQNKDGGAERFTKSYAVNDECEPWFTTMKEKHYIKQFPLYDSKDDLIQDISVLEDKLVGALVEVTFSLKHYYITSKTDKPNDTFTAIIENITILKPPPTVSHGPYRSLLSPKKKPARRIQTPLGISTRGKQINAAKSFIPVPQPIFTPKGTAINPSGSASSTASSSSSHTLDDSQQEGDENDDEGRQQSPKRPRLV
ncbi:hypothetical protein JR316_0003133 [Psilocybe cubensis]|nr:hypothetical protein JR316_0003133 [Psilocybe cubensis]KAH9483663.1 hypothetical protein JR316_0003133 [Psilocybe cubensis]